MDGVYDTVKMAIGTKKITPENISLIVIGMMQIVEQYPGQTGDQKKSMVLQLLNRLVSDTVKDHGEAVLINSIINATVPMLIDNLILLDKGEIAIEIKKKCWKCFCG